MARMTIRRVPEDFVVEEVIAPGARARWSAARAGGSEHAVLELRKKSLTTPDAVGHLAKALGVRAGTVDYAGLKDKHAVTTQHVSVKLDQRMAAKLGAQTQWTDPGVDSAGSGAGAGWSARLVGWSAGPVTAEAIGANRFTIVVRDLSRAACE